MKKSVGLLPFTFLMVCYHFTFPVSAQTSEEVANTSNNYIVGQVDDTLNISKSGYYLNEILDLRTNQANNGNIIINDVKNGITFANGLPLFASSFVFPQNSNQNTELAPLSIQIEKLKCFATTNGKTDEAQLYLKLNFYNQTNAKLIKTFENTFNYKRSSQSDFIAKLIFSSFKTALNSLKNKEISTPKELMAKSSNSNYLDKENIFTIPLPSKKLVWTNPIYQIKNIQDARSFNRNEGNVSIGFFNIMAIAKLDSSLEYYFSNSISTDSSSSKTPLTLQIKSFRILEQETAAGEQGSVFLKASLTKDSLGNRYSVYSKTIAFDTTADFDLTKQWPSIIQKVVSDFLKSFDTTSIPKSQLLSYEKNNEEIIVERFYYTHKYYWKGTELKNLKDFNAVINKINDNELSQKFNSSMNYIRTGRALNCVGFALLGYSFIDYLLVEDKSMKNWYKSTSYASNFTRLAGDKKILIWGGLTTIVSSFILRKSGKSELLKTIGLYNKSLAEKLSLSYVPNINNQGHLFQLNLIIGQR